MIGSSDAKTVDIRGVSIITPRGEAAGVMMVDYGRDRDSVFYGHLKANGFLVRAEACDVKVLGEAPPNVAQAFEPLLTMGTIQAALGADHGFDVGQLTKHQMFVNSQRGEVEPQVWMPYYKFLTSLLMEVACIGVRNLVALRQCAEDNTGTARRLDGMIARAKQKLVALARATGIGPKAGEPLFVDRGEENAREVERFIGKAAEAADDTETVVKLRAFLTTLHSQLGSLRNDVADAPALAVSIVTDFVRMETENIAAELNRSSPIAAMRESIGVLSRAG